MTLSYRPAKRADATDFAQIIHAWGAETPWMVPLEDMKPMADFWADLIDENQGWVAECHGRVVGFCTREVGNVGGLYLLREARGQGCGKHLLDLAKADRDWIIVWAYEANEGARAFYRREGLAEICREMEEETGLMNVELRWTRTPLSPATRGDEIPSFPRKSCV